MDATRWRKFTAQVEGLLITSCIAQYQQVHSPTLTSLLIFYDTNILKEIYTILTRAELNKNDFKQELKTTLLTHWQWIMHSRLSYTANPDRESTKLLWELASLLCDNPADKQAITAILMPTVTHIGELEHQAHLGTHIISDDGTTLIPISLLLNLHLGDEHLLAKSYITQVLQIETDRGWRKLSASEAFRLQYHSELSQQYCCAYDEHQAILSGQCQSLLGAVATLRNQFRQGGAHGDYNGTETNASPLAAIGYNEFINFWNKLKPDQQARARRAPNFNEFINQLPTPQTADGYCVEMAARLLDEIITNTHDRQTLIQIQPDLPAIAMPSNLEEATQHFEQLKSELRQSLSHPGSAEGHDRLNINPEHWLMLQIPITLATPARISDFMEALPPRDRPAHVHYYSTEITETLLHYNTNVFNIPNVRDNVAELYLYLPLPTFQTLLFELSNYDFYRVFSQLNVQDEIISNSTFEILADKLLAVTTDAMRMLAIYDILPTALGLRYIHHIANTSGKLKSLIRNVNTFLMIYYGLGPQARNAYFKHSKVYLSEIKINSGLFVVIIHTLAPDHKEQYFTLMTSQLVQITHNIANFQDIYFNLAPAQQTQYIYALAARKIPAFKVITASIEDCVQIHQTLFSEHQDVYLSALTHQTLAKIIHGPTDFITLYSVFSTQQRNFYFQKLLPHLIQLDINSRQYVMIINSLAPAHRTRYISLMATKLTQLTHDTISFRDIYESLGPEQQTQYIRALTANTTPVLNAITHSIIHCVQIHQTLFSEHQENYLSALTHQTLTKIIQSPDDFITLYSVFSQQQQIHYFQRLLPDLIGMIKSDCEVKKLRKTLTPAHKDQFERALQNSAQKVRAFAQHQCQQPPASTSSQHSARLWPPKDRHQQRSFLTPPMQRFANQR